MSFEWARDVLCGWAAAVGAGRWDRISVRSAASCLAVAEMNTSDVNESFFGRVPKEINIILLFPTYLLLVMINAHILWHVTYIKSFRINNEMQLNVSKKSE